MDIDIDQSVPRNDMIMTPDGKYFYIDPDDGKPYIDVFRRDFEQWRDRRRRRSEEQLERLNDQQSEATSKITPLDFIINMKDVVFETFDDLLKGDVHVYTFTQGNRLIYLGIFIMIFSIIVYILIGCR
jgi:hypothetical protein